MNVTFRDFDTKKPVIMESLALRAYAVRGECFAGGFAGGFAGFCLCVFCLSCFFFFCEGLLFFKLVLFDVFNYVCEVLLVLCFLFCLFSSFCLGIQGVQYHKNWRKTLSERGLSGSVCDDVLRHRRGLCGHGDRRGPRSKNVRTFKEQWR